MAYKRPPRPRPRRVKTNDPKESFGGRGRTVKVDLGKPPKPTRQNDLPKPPRFGGGPAKPPPNFGAQAQAQLDSIYGPVLGQYAQLIQSRQAETAAQAKAKADAFRSFAEWYQKNGPPQVQDVYTKAGGNQSAFAKGFSDGFTASMKDLASTSNQQLSLIGAPEGQQIHVGPSSGGDAIYGMGGAIPSGMLNQQGAAFAAAAAMQSPAIFAEGQRQAAEIEKAGMSDVEKLRMEEAELRSDMASKKEDRIADLKSTAAKNKAILADNASDLYNDGLITQREFARRIGIKNWRTYPKTKKPQEAAGIDASASKLVGFLVDDNGNFIRDKKGKPIPILGEPEEAPEPEIRSQGGYIWERDPRTGKWKKVAGTGPAARAAANKSGGDPYVIYVSGVPMLYDPKTKSVSPLKGTGGAATPGAAPGLDQKDIAAARIAAAKALAPKGKTRLEQGKNRPTWQAAVDEVMTEAGVTRDIAAWAVWSKGGKSLKGAPKRRPAPPKADAAATGGRQDASFDPTVPPIVNNAIAFAKKQLGQKYVWGAEGRNEGGFDCSGLIDWAFRQVGIDLPGRLTTWSAAQLGRPVPLDTRYLKAGDMIISNGGKHMTLYIGNGQVIAASSARGRVVIQNLSDLGTLTAARRLDFSGYA